MTDMGTLEVKLDALTAAFEKSMASATEAVEKHKLSLGTIASAAGAAFAGLTGAIAIATRAYGESREAALKLDSVLANTAIDPQVIKDYAAELQRLTTFEDDATIAATATLASFGATQDQLLRLMGPMQDIAAFMGGDMKAAALMMGKALDGQGAALSRAGIALSATQEGLLKTGTQTQRVDMLVSALRDRFGGLAAAMTGTATGAFTQLQNAAGDIVEEFGRMLESPLIAMFRSLAEAARVVSDLMSGLSDSTRLYIGIGVLVATALAGITAAVAGLAIALPPVIAGFAAAIAICAPFIATLAGIAVGAAILITGFALVRKAWRDDLGGIRSLVTGFANWLGETWDSVTAHLREAWDSAFGWVGKQLKAWWDLNREGLRTILPGVDEFLATFSTDAVGVMGASWKKIAAAGAGAWDTIKGAAGGAWDGITDATADYFRTMKETSGKALDFLLGAFKDLAESVGIDFDAIKKKLDDIFAAPKARAAGPAGGGGGGGEVSTIGGGGPGISSTLPGDDLMGEFQAKVTSIFSSAGDGIGAAMGTAAKMFADAVGQYAPRAATVIQGAMQGFAAGGEWGALAGAIAAFVTTLDSFKGIMDVVERGLGTLAEGFDQILEPLLPLVDAIGSVGETFFKMIWAIIPLKPILSVLGAAIKVVSDAFGYVAKGFQLFADWLSTAWEDVMYEVGKVFKGWMDPIANALMGPKLKRMANANVAATAEAIKARTDEQNEAAKRARAAEKNAEASGHILTEAEKAAIAKQAADAAAELAQRDLANAVKTTTSAFVAATAALLNVPAGFKLAAARFAAIGDTAGAMSLAGAGAGAGAGSMISIGNIFLQANSPEEFLDQLESAAAWRNFANTGTTANTPPNPSKR